MQLNKIISGSTFPFFHLFPHEEKHFVDLGLSGSVPAANYSFALLVNETHLIKKLAD